MVVIFEAVCRLVSVSALTAAMALRATEDILKCLNLTGALRAGHEGKKDCSRFTKKFAGHLKWFTPY